jgi:hypothetical protein
MKGRPLPWKLAQLPSLPADDKEAISETVRARERALLPQDVLQCGMRLNGYTGIGPRFEYCSLILLP